MYFVSLSRRRYLGFVTRSCPLIGMRDKPLITSAVKAAIMGDSKKVDMVERATQSPS